MAAEARAAGTVTLEVVVLVDSSSLEAAAGDGGAEAATERTAPPKVVMPNHASRLQLALVRAPPVLDGGPTLTMEHPRCPGKALFSLNDVLEMALWGSALGHGRRVHDKLAKAQDLLRAVVGVVSDAFGAIDGEVLPRGQVIKFGSFLLGLRLISPECFQSFDVLFPVVACPFVQELMDASTRKSQFLHAAYQLQVEKVADWRRLEEELATSGVHTLRWSSFGRP